MAELWRHHQRNVDANSATASSNEVLQNPSAEVIDLQEISMSARPLAQDSGRYVRRKTPGFFYQLAFFVDRTVLQLVSVAVLHRAVCVGEFCQMRYTPPQQL